jgi:hypothetical protein
MGKRIAMDRGSGPGEKHFDFSDVFTLIGSTQRQVSLYHECFSQTAIPVTAVLLPWGESTEILVILTPLG